MVGNNVSHSKRRTKRVFGLNLKTKKFWSEAEQRFVTLKVSCKGMRTIEKIGVDENKKNTTERLERKKYNPYLKRVTVHREIK